MLSEIVSLLEAGRSVEHILQDNATSALFSEHLLDRENTRKLAKAIARTRSPQEAHRVIELAHKMGSPLKQNVYEGVSHQLAEAKHWHLIPSLVVLGINNTGRTTVRLLNWRIRAYVEMNHHASLDRVFEEFEQQNLKPNRRTFHLLISGHVRNRNLVKAKACLHRMEEAGFHLDSSSHALLVSVYRSLGPDTLVQARAFEALRDVYGSTATTVLNSLLQLRLDAHDFPGAMQVLSLFDRDNDPVNLAPNSGGSTTRGGGKYHLSPKRPPPLPSRTRSDPMPNPVPFDVATFSILINHMLTRHEAPQAVKIFHNMIAAGIRPDAPVVADLVRAYFAMGDEVSAVCIVEKLCEGHEEASRLFNQFIPVKEGKSGLSFDPKGIPLSIEIFNALMDGILGTRGLSGGDVVLRIMSICHIKPDTQTIDLLIAHLDKHERAFPQIILYALKEIYSTGVSPTLRHVHAVLRSVMRHEKQLLRGSGWNVPAAKFSSRRHDLSRYPEDRISGVSKSFDPTAGIELPRSQFASILMRPIVKSLSSRLVRSDRATIAMRIRHDAVHKSDLESARVIFRGMLARGMHPNEYHFSALMEGYTHKGELKAAKDVFNSAVRAGITPNVVMFTILIVGHARQGDPGSAMRVFRNMVAAGIKPDVPAIDAVASAYFIVGAYKRAKQVLTRLWSHIEPFPAKLHSVSLLELTRTFRSLHKDDGGIRKRLTNEESLLLRQKLKGLVLTWKSMKTVRTKRHIMVSSRRRVM